MSNVYESLESLHQYLDLHYTAVDSLGVQLPKLLPHEDAPNHALQFCQQVAHLTSRLCPHRQSVLDIGGAVGGTAFELAKDFERVHSMDYSQQFIDTAQKLQRGENVEVSIQEQGSRRRKATVVAPPLAQRELVTFFVGDACRLGDLVQVRGQTYQAMVLSNLLCRLPHPRACLESLPKYLESGGIVVIVTPFTWMHEYTQPSEWIGGTEQEDSLEILTQIMTGLGFTKIHDQEMPLMIREHARKYQYIISRATGWRLDQKKQE
jgi:putative 4-mercaptohistidine N1-methyltranferase